VVTLREEIIFTYGDFVQFRGWLKLNLEGITWQGRYSKEFEEFWNLFFIQGLSLKQVVERFDYADREIQHGPLSSWFNWLRDKFLCYTFIYKNVSLIQLADTTGPNIATMATILRNFFLDHAPHKVDHLNNVFQVANISGPNIHLTFAQLKKDLGLTKDIVGGQDHEIMPEMEITLYDEWRQFLKKIKRDFYHYDIDLSKIRANASFRNQLRLLREIALLLVIGVVAVYGIQFFNRWYERYLADKISIYEPQFLWIDKTLNFKNTDSAKVVQEIKPQLEKVNLNAKIEGTDDSEKVASYNEESDVVLTSWDALPRDFNLTEMEKSDYEEMTKGGYRDYRFGSGKAFRVLMNSVDLSGSRKTIDALLARYQVTRADNVRPGTLVPGGLYYNLYVPTRYLKEFLAQVVDVEDAVLYESRTPAGGARPGMSKVFIWIKSY